jgi:hypothetical protein
MSHSVRRVVARSGTPIVETDSIRIVEMPDIGAVTDASSVVGERAGSGRFGATALKTYINSYTAPGTGGITRSVITKAGEWVSVMDYGAVGDGVADDTAKIQAAINYVQTLPTGGTVLFPPGNYKTSATLTISKAGVSLLGMGRAASVIKPVAGSTFDWLLVHSDISLSYISIASLGFVPFGQQATGHVGICQTGRAAVCTYQDIQLTNAYQGFRVEAGIDGSVCRWVDFYIANCTGSAFWIGADGSPVVSFTARDGDIAQCGGGFLLQNCSGVYLSAINIILCTIGVHMAPEDGDMVAFVFCDMVLADTSTQDGWYFHTVGTGIIGNIVCNNCWAATAGLSGVHVEVGCRLDGFTWADGHVLQNYAHGFQFNGGTNLSVSNTQVYNNNIGDYAAPPGVGGHGIAIGPGVSGFRLIGNTCGPGGWHRLMLGPNRQHYGIYVATGASDHYVVMGNVCSGNVTGGTFDGGTGTAKSVVSNVV